MTWLFIALAVVAVPGVAYVLLQRWGWRQWTERETAQCAADRVVLEQYFDYHDAGDGTVTMTLKDAP
jgi:hypothetical protein